MELAGAIGEITRQTLGTRPDKRTCAATALRTSPLLQGSRECPRSFLMKM